jgi:hypothetical protein
MKTHTTIKMVFASVLMTVAAAAQNVTPAMKSSTDLAVVVNTRNPTSEISASALSLLLSGERRFWNGNAPVQLVLRQPGSREFDVAVNRLLKMNGTDFRQVWKTRVFRGEAHSEPTYVPSSGMAAQFSRDLPGALTVLAACDLPNDAKVLKVDGKYPGEPGYPLK